MKSWSGVALLLLGVLAVGLGEEVETDAPAAPVIPESAPGVETHAWFPKHGGGLSFTQGEQVEVVLGFRNGYNGGLNVTNITGALRGPWSYGFQHFQPPYGRVPEGQDISLSYKFPIDRQLGPLQYQVALQVAYMADDATPFITTFFNQTITVVEKSVLIDTEQIFMWMIIAGLLLLPAWAGYRYLSSLPFFKKAAKRTKKVETAQGERDTSEWLSGTYYAQQAKGKVPKGKPGNVKNVKAKAG